MVNGQSNAVVAGPLVDVTLYGATTAPTLDTRRSPPGVYMTINPVAPFCNTPKMQLVCGSRHTFYGYNRWVSDPVQWGAQACSIMTIGNTSYPYPEILSVYGTTPLTLDTGVQFNSSCSGKAIQCEVLNYSAS